MPKYTFECLGCGERKEKYVTNVMEEGKKLYNDTPCSCGSADWIKVFTLPTGTKSTGFTTPARKD